MNDQDLKQIEELIKKHKPSIRTGSEFLLVLFVLFIGGFFKGCGY